MKLIEVKLAKSVPDIPSTIVIKMSHGLSSIKFKTQIIIFDYEGITEWL